MLNHSLALNWYNVPIFYRSNSPHRVQISHVLLEWVDNLPLFSIAYGPFQRQPLLALFFAIFPILRYFLLKRGNKGRSKWGRRKFWAGDKRYCLFFVYWKRRIHTLFFFSIVNCIKDTNRYRYKHYNTGRLKWDTVLAQQAQAYAEKLMRIANIKGYVGLIHDPMKPDNIGETLFTNMSPRNVADCREANNYW